MGRGGLTRLPNMSGIVGGVIGLEVWGSCNGSRATGLLCDARGVRVLRLRMTRMRIFSDFGRPIVRLSVGVSNSNIG
jgi:hypothetical protein